MRDCHPGQKAMAVQRNASRVVVVESVFAYPGVGQLAFEAVLARDYPVLQAVFLLAGAAVLVANAVADAALARLDPRLRGAA